ncbi:hypothetical protein EDF56_11516 [Novosphingobium sp. PhB165]|uniref:hypothetical protein n=1 Tax=Novosphingobium sp. PhB165 TaxID=2485105 RepID=UPI0010CF4E58|nr:hypothetical protein [Novosphingobium sp. PhB165]TCM13991.1 hypothetical protein EDF56_11516 [Novosphingobium sp. PhB165]
MMNDSDKPSSRRLGRAGIFVVAVIAAVFVVVFVGRNIWHAEKETQEERTGVKEQNGLN